MSAFSSYFFPFRPAFRALARLAFVAGGGVALGAFDPFPALARVPVDPLPTSTPAPTATPLERHWIPANLETAPEGSPAMLVMYPLDATRLGAGTTRTRYAGRVEPPDARVTLNGAAVRLYPGGTFTGLLDLKPGENVFEFRAEAASSGSRAGSPRGVAVARRTVHRAEPPRPGATPDFARTPVHPSAPVSPVGDYLLAPTSELGVRLRAAPGRAVFWCIGQDPAPPWRRLDLVATSPDGWVDYRGTLTVDPAAVPVAGVPFPVRFRLESDSAPPVEFASELRLGLAPSPPRVGIVTQNRATFLKAKEGWERFGNWNAGTPFEALELWKDRLRVDFGAGPAGFVEVEYVAPIAWAGPSGGASGDAANASAGTLPVLPRPALADAFIAFDGGPATTRFSLEWPAPAPLASVFVHEPAPTPNAATALVLPESDRAGVGNRTGRLTVDLLGAASALPGRFIPREAAFLRSVEILDAAPAPEGLANPSPSPPGLPPSGLPRPVPPRVVAEFAGRELWGYDWRDTARGARRLVVRLRPDPPAATPERPLGGLRIMVDAGHGGTDQGALGPSGLAEADVNLIVSLALGRELEALGARVRQTRRSDVFVPLDERVQIALDEDPDLFVSVHHNSVAFETDPLGDRGSKVYYHYPHSEPTARAIAVRLAELWPAPLPPAVAPMPPRTLSENFRVCRNVSGCPSVLVENAFVCHPEDEFRLRDRAHLDASARAIARGIVDLLAAR